ncbi:MAG: ATP-binding protein [Steroidobacteraceae bacterium]
MISKDAGLCDKGQPVRARPWLPLAYVLAHVALDAASFVQPVLKLGITPISPQTGLAIAFLMSARRGFGWLVLALMLSEVIVRGVPDEPLPVVLQLIGLSAIYQLAAIVSRYWISRTEESPLRQSLGFITIAATTAAGAALFSVGVFILAGLLPDGRFWAAVARFWVGDLNGILMLTPLLVRFDRLPMMTRQISNKKWHIAGIGASLLVSFYLIFLLGNPGDLRFFYLLFVPAIAAALTWGIPGLLITALIFQIGLMIGVQRIPAVAPLVDLQYLMSTLLVTGLALGAVVRERELSSRLALQRERLLRETESNLARATRYAMTGELASTLAHELNQPMTALVGYLRASEIMVASSNSQESRISETLKKAADEALRATDILRRIRDFYAGKDPQMESFLIVDAVQALADTLRKSSRNCELHVPVNQASSGVLVEADRVFVEVILANLLSNAFDSASNGGKTVSISIESVTARRVSIRVDDNGAGIPEVLLPQLFKPFVTTKAGGMGIGLAVSHSLAVACGGELRICRSSLGGACFELMLNQPLIR